MKQAVRLIAIFFVLSAPGQAVWADATDGLYDTVDRMIEPKFASPADKINYVKNNMHHLQQAAEGYASHHSGKFPTKVDQSFKSYLPFGEADDKNFTPWSAFLNPFSKKKEWAVLGPSLPDLKAAQTVTSPNLKPGNVEYCPINGGANFAIRAGGPDGKRLPDKPRFFVLSHDTTEAAFANMKTLQWSAELFAENHLGEFPKQINDEFKCFFPGGDFEKKKIGHPMANPFTGKAEWPIVGSMTNLTKARLMPPSKLAPGVLEYNCLPGGRNYAIRCGGGNGIALAGPHGPKSTLCISKDVDGMGHQ